MTKKNTVTFTARDDVPKSWTGQIVNLLFGKPRDVPDTPDLEETISDGSRWNTWEIEIENVEPS